MYLTVNEIYRIRDLSEFQANVKLSPGILSQIEKTSIKLPTIIWLSKSFQSKKKDLE